MDIRTSTTETLRYLLGVASLESGRAVPQSDTDLILAIAIHAVLEELDRRGE